MQLVPKKGFPPYLLTVVLHFEAGALFVILSQAPNLKMLGLLQVKQWVQVPVQKDEIVYFFFSFCFIQKISYLYDILQMGIFNAKTISVKFLVLIFWVVTFA